MSQPQTAGSPTRRRRVPTLIAAFVVLVAGLAAAVVPSSPAAAGPDIHIVYCEEHRLPDGRLIVPCWVLDEVWLDLRPDPDPCLTCPFAVQFRWSIDPGDFVVNEVANNMLGGLHSLLAASVEKDPQLQKVYREQAWASYGVAADKLGQAQLTVGEVWIGYKEGKAGDPTPQPNKQLFEQYGNGVIAGLDLLQAAKADPNKAQYYQQLARQVLGNASGAFAKAISDL